MTWDARKAVEEASWLIAHPQFTEKPATIREFLGEGYLDIEAKVRAGLIKALEDIFGEEVNAERIGYYERAMITGAIGIGKTTFASIALPYMAHWVLCLRDPQGFFGLLPGARIAFMQMSTSEQQAREVIFGDIFARIQHADWFVNNYPHDTKYTKQIRFAKDIWIIPGDSQETTFEGYNILGGILDEMDSHKVTDNKDYADVGYTTIDSRISSRFPVLDEDGNDAGHLGLLICIGQMKKATGFAATKFKEFNQDPRAYTMTMTIWESFGWDRYKKKDGSRNSFWYDKKRKQIIPSLIADITTSKDLIEVPVAYLTQFKNGPEKALRDLAGIPPTVSDPFISLVDRIEECRERWIERHGDASPVKDTPTRVIFEDWFRANGDPRKRHVHIDLATSGDGDALGMAMGHVEAVQEIGGENKPYIVIDAMMRIKARPGMEIFLSDVRRILYHLRDDLGFKLYSVSMDGFQSTDTMQQLRKSKFMVDYLSVDKSTLPYEDLREAVYERRLELPPYLTYMRSGDTERVEIAVKELMELTDTGRKIDHPPEGSKDVADALAGVVTTLMGDRTYRKGTGSSRATGRAVDAEMIPSANPEGVSIDYSEMGGMHAPAPPMPGNTFGLAIPSRLCPR